MKKVVLRITAVIFALSFIFTVISCTKTRILEYVGIEIAAQPTKLTYYEGETFDPTGLKIDAITENGTKEICLDYVIDQVEAFKRGDTKVSIRYSDYQVFIDVEVLPFGVKDVEFRTGETVFDIEYRTEYTDGTKDETWVSVTADDIAGYEYKNGKLNLKLEVFVKNTILKKNFEIDCLSVSELLTKEIDEVYFVKGIIVAIATTMAKPEYVIFDQASQKMIGVYNMHNGGNLNKLELDTNGFAIGDEVVIPVKLNKEDEKAQYSDSNKINAEFVGQNMLDCAIISRGNEYTLDKTQATLITNQEQLVDFLTVENRHNNFYKLVKLHGETSYIFYSSSAHYRFFFDKTIKTLAAQKVDNCSPCFANGAQHYTTGTTIGEMLLGDANKKPTSWSSPARSTKDIYAVFIGGNSYYHEFVILNEEDVTDGIPDLVSKSFVEPTNVEYSKGATLNVEGAKIVYTYTFGNDKEIDVTLDMINEEDKALLDVVGTHTINGSYEGFNFSFEVVVKDKALPRSIEVLTEPTTLTYGHRDSLATLDLTGGKIKVTYEDNTTEEVDMAAEMLPETDDAWKIGDVTYTLTHLGLTTTLTVTYENRAISLSEFLTKTEGEHDVCAVVVGPLSSMAAPELLVQDKTTGEFIGIWNTKVAGAYDAPKLDESFVKVGDEIIFKASLKTINADGANKGKLFAQPGSEAKFKESLIVVSHNNQINTTIDESEVVTISTQEELVNFINSPDRFFKIVKLVQPKAVSYSAPKGGLRIFFGDSVTKIAEQRINGYSPYIQRANTALYVESGLDSLFENSTSTAYSDPATTTSTIYAMFFGGNTYYHLFTILDESWIVEAEAPTLVSTEFVEPTKSIYFVGDALSLAGAKITYTYSNNQTTSVDVTVSMLNQEDVAKLATVGTHTINGTYEGFNFSFEVVVSEVAPTSIEVLTEPTTLTYGHRDSLATLDLTGGKIKVNYSNNTSAEVDMTAEMLPETDDAWQIGEVTYTLTYLGLTTTLTVTYENRAISLSEFLTKTEGEHDVCAVVVGPLSSMAAIELLVQDKTTGEFIGIWNTKVAGAYDAPKLDESFVKVGDEIIFKASLATVAKPGANKGKLFAQPGSEAKFKESLIVVSHNNQVNTTINESEVETISTQEELVTFLNSADRFFKIVKLVTPKAVNYGTAPKGGLRIYFDETISSNDEQKVNGISPYIQRASAAIYVEQGIDAYFTNSESATYDNPATTTSTIYAMFFGGNTNYQVFTILDDAWIVTPTQE